tara:strand:- start:3541 stop:4263 length:723 start_codon:yes stop_codon:yes gene_type:complete
MAKQPEPDFGLKLNKLGVLRAMNWYHMNRSELDSRRFLHDYAKNNVDSSLTVNDVSRWNYLTSEGWIARLLSKGVEFPDLDQEFKFKNMIQKCINDVVEVEKSPAVERKPKKIKVEVGILGELEHQLDVFIDNNCKMHFDPIRFLSGHNVKRKDCTNIKRWTKIERQFMEEVIQLKPDKQLKEAYSNLSKPELKRIHKFYDSLHNAADKYMRSKVKKRTTKNGTEASVTQTILETHLNTL